eukprot:TRINITY_DN32307_c0_g1_i1.p1 TRINITY_DN32307_c0_g1~~TRINITY_DN32307_c0_g1_i1.p1  ORF type:complete len:302 (-),score=42.48 TRINITY_DN32307_c0_g1_i1:70-975(-)
MQVCVASCVSGEIVWGPRQVRRAERAGWVRRRLATSLECELDVIKLLHGARQLDDEDPIEALVAAEEDVLQLTVVCGDDGAGAAEVFRRLQQTGTVQFSQGKEGSIIVSDDPAGAVQHDECVERLTEIASACDVEQLPPELCSWLEVLMTGGKILRVARNDGYGLYVSDWSGPLVGSDAKHSPGLFCLSARWRNDQGYKRFIVFFVDLKGTLYDVYGSEQDHSSCAGSVWIGQWVDSAWNDLEQQLQNSFGASGVPNLDMLRQMKQGQMEVPGLGFDMMRCVAPSLSRFLRDISHSGTLPS